MRFDFTFNLSNVVELLTMMITLYGLHRANVKRSDQNKERLARIETKVDLIYGWWQDLWQARRGGND